MAQGAADKEFKIQELTAHVMAAELNLTLFASRYGKDSDMYRQCLKDFATAWYLLRKQRDHHEFVLEVSAS